MTNPVIDCLMNHRSIRKFQEKKIDSDTLNTILSAGIRAATAGNLQHYSLLVIDDKEKLKEIEFADMPLVIVVLADQYRVTRWFEQNETQKPVNNKAQNLFISIWDALIVLQNIVIAAESLGLGTCYFGDILSMDAKKIFDIPEYTFPIGMVGIGYPEQESKLSMRLPLEAVVHKNSYKMPSDEELKCWYKERAEVWNTVPQERKKKLAEQNIFNLAQAIAVQKFSHEFIDNRSEGIIENIKRGKFQL